MAHLDALGVTRLVTDLKARFAALAHTHAAASDITGQLPIANGGTGSSTASAAVAALGALTNGTRTAFTDAMFASQLTAGCFMYAGAGSTLTAAPAEIAALSTDVFLLVDVYAPATDWTIQIVKEPATGCEWSRQTRDGGTTWTSWMRIGVGNVLPVANGGTGASTASGARTNLDAAQDDSSGITLADAGSNISTLLATTGIASTPSGKTLQGQISTLQDSVSDVSSSVTKSQVLRFRTDHLSTSSYDAYTENGIWYMPSSNTYTNAPFASPCYTYLFVIHHVSADVIQMVFNVIDGNAKIRTRNNGTWKAWKVIAS